MARGTWEKRREGKRRRIESPLLPGTTRPRPRALFKHDGHSLLELLVAMGAGAVVLAAAIEGVLHLREHFVHQQERAAMQQDLRIGLGVFASEVRLAGLGAQLEGRILLTTKPDEVSFYANLSGLWTTLTKPVSAGEGILPVRNGRGWSRGKRVFICDQHRCTHHRLFRNGHRGVLHLTNTLARAFPKGSQVILVNYVRYYLRKDTEEEQRLMRMVDGGASTFIRKISALKFSYFDKHGRPAVHPSRSGRLRVELTVGKHGRPVRQEIPLGT